MSNSLTFYRCVFTYPLVREDFMSKAALGERLRSPDTAKRRQLFAGVSVYTDIEIARAQALRLNPSTAYLAELQNPDDGPIAYKHSFRIEAHYTLWASPEDLLRRVVSVIQVSFSTERTEQ